MMNSSTCPESRKVATSSAPPTSQVSLPFSERRRSEKTSTSSLRILTFELAAFDSMRENTQFFFPGVSFRHSKANRKIVGLAPQNTVVDGAIESAHAVVPLLGADDLAIQPSHPVVR